MISASNDLAAPKCLKTGTRQKIVREHDVIKYKQIAKKVWYRFIIVMVVLITCSKFRNFYFMRKGPVYTMLCNKPEERPAAFFLLQLNPDVRLQNHRHQIQQRPSDGFRLSSSST